MMAQEDMENGYRWPSGAALVSSVRMSSAAEPSKGAGSHSPLSDGRSRPPLGAIHTSCPPCSQARSRNECKIRLKHAGSHLAPLDCQSRSPLGTAHTSCPPCTFEQQGCSTVQTSAW